MSVGATPLSRMREKQLTELIKTYRNGSGYDRLVRISQIKEILAKTEPRSMISYIESINNDDSLNILLGCGLRGIIWQAVIKQKAILTGL